jgi:hypothetical protein
MTASEAAEYAATKKAAMKDAPVKVHEFLLNAPPREVVDFIHIVICIDPLNRYLQTATACLDIRLAEEAAKQADNLSKQVDRLVHETVVLARFTRGLLWLTITLCLFGGIQIFIMLIEYCSKAH